MGSIEETSAGVSTDDRGSSLIRRDVTLSLAQVNLLGIPVALAPLALVGAPFVLLWGPSQLLEGLRAFLRPASAVPAVIVGAMLHELIHAAGWVLFARKPWRSIRFGFKWKTLTPYAHCREPMPAAAYRWGAVLPGVLLGFLPAVAGMITGDGWSTVFGILFLVAAAGDGIVLWVIRSVPGRTLVEDHAERAGCYVYEHPVTR
jgi:Putative zincin peptidase